MKTVKHLSMPSSCLRHARRGSARGWILFLLIVLIAVGGGWLAMGKLKGEETLDTSGGTVKAKRGDLLITVTEGGSIRAHQSVEYRCQVESRGISTGITILSLVPAGTYITPEDVDNGRILIELDSSALEDRLLEEDLELNSAKESAIAAKESYDIQVKQNESDIASAEMTMRFALMDLQKYLGTELANRLIVDGEDANNLTTFIAPYIQGMQKDPTTQMDPSSEAGQQYKSYMDDIILAEGNLKTAEATLDGTRKLYDANYVSFLDLQTDELSVKNKSFATESAKVTLNLFLQYDFPKNAEQYLSDYIESKRELSRTRAECRSKLAQAKVTLSSAEERLRRQQREVDELNQQVDFCTIRAKAPGLVVYGTGGSDDMFRAMRGRGSGSGIISEGETVSERQVLISMPDTKTMIAEISVHETEVDKVMAGQPVSIVMDAFPDKTLTGVVTEVAPLPDQQRGWMNPDLKVYKTLVTIDGTHESLKSRMSCKVEILVDELYDVVLVPIQVVANRGGRKVCFVVTSNGPEERVVRTGSFSDTMVQIVDGLQEGEEVLLNPPMLFGEGQGDDSQQNRFERPASAQTMTPTAKAKRPQRGQGREDGKAPAESGQMQGMPQGIPDMSQFNNMSDEEKQKAMEEGMKRLQSMSAEERQELMKKFQGGGMPGSGAPQQ